MSFIVIVFPVGCILVGAYAKYREVFKRTSSVKCDPLSPLPHQVVQAGVLLPVTIQSAVRCLLLTTCSLLGTPSGDRDCQKSCSQPATRFPRQIICGYMYTHMHIHTVFDTITTVLVEVDWLASTATSCWEVERIRWGHRRIVRHGEVILYRN